MVSFFKSIGIEVQAPVIKSSNKLINDNAIIVLNNLLKSNSDTAKKPTTIYQQTSFDICLANPPYVKSSNIDSITKDYIANHLSLPKLPCELHNKKRNSEKHKSYGRNLYTTFVQLCMNICDENVFLIPNSFMHNKGSKPLADFVCQGLLSPIVNHNHNKFFMVDVYTAIFHFSVKDIIANSSSNAQNQSQIVTRIAHNEKDKKQLSLGLFDECDVSDEADEVLHNNIQTKNHEHIVQQSLFKKWLSDNNGVLTEKVEKQAIRFITCLATLCNDVYFIKADSDLHKSIISAGETGILASMFGKGSARSGINENQLFAIYPYVHLDGEKSKVMDENELKKRFPVTYKHLLSHKQELLSRDNGKAINLPFWYQYGREQGLQNGAIDWENESVILFGNTYKTGVDVPILIDKNHMEKHGYDLQNKLVLKTNMGIVLQKSVAQIYMDFLQSETFITWIENSSAPIAGGYFRLQRSAIQKLFE